MSAAAAIPLDVAFPPSEFKNVATSDVKEKLKAIKRAKQQAAAARHAAAASSSTATSTINLIDDEDQMQFESTSASNGHVAAASSAAVVAVSSSNGAPAAAASSSSSSRPSAFSANEDFISLASFAAPVTPVSSANTPARGIKRRLDGGEDDATHTSERTVIEGAYRAPWAQQPYTHPNFTLRLHEEILDFCTYVAPKPEEQKMREELIARIETIAREAFPQAPNLQLKPFGSYATRLYLPISDIDLVLFGVDPSHATAPSMEKGKNSALGLLERTMRTKQNASYLEHISGARIPILKFTDKLTNVKVDICYEIEGGLKAAEFIVAMQQQMPALRPLTLFLKYFLHCRILNDTYKGGIGSFMLQLMLINHLQVLQYEGRLNSPTTNLGMILMSFLESYGVSLNYKLAGLNMTPASSTSASGPRAAFFNKSTKGWFNQNRPYLLSIENPLDASHDVGSNSYLILRVRKALQFAYQTLSAHIFHEERTRERGSRGGGKKVKLDGSSPAVSLPFPFAAASHTPQTLLSHIVSVNENIRAGQEEVEYEDMERSATQEEKYASQRAAHVHIIESSDDEQDSEIHIIEQPNFGEAEADLSDDAGDDDEDDAAIDAALGNGVADENGDMSVFEKRLGVDVDDEGDESEGEDGEISDDDENGDEDGEDDEVSDEDDEDDDGGAMDIDVEDAPYDDGETYAQSKGNKKSKSPHRNTNHHVASSSSNSLVDADFIPLSAAAASATPYTPHKKGGGKRYQKSSSYNFSHTSTPSTSKKSKPAKSKQKPLLRGNRTGGTTPNNAIYESNKSKSKKKQAKKQRNHDSKKQSKKNKQ